MALPAEEMLNVVQVCLHGQRSEWIFLRELRVGTGLRARSGQRVDAFALNCFAHLAMKRVCYEVKTSRADFLCELKHPIKRRLGLRYSNEFYFVTPARLLDISEIPIECGLVEVGLFTPEENRTTAGQGSVIHFDSSQNTYCRVTVPAPWRETPAPTWQFVAAMLRHQQRAASAPLERMPRQQKLSFAD